MIRDTAVRQARLPAGEYAGLLRAMTGSRRKAPGITDLEPFIDVLVHGQDIALPLDRVRPMPAPAVAAAATRAWSMGRPFQAERKLAGLHLTATDHPWQAGEGLAIEGPIAAILLLITGRPAALSQLSGPGTVADIRPIPSGDEAWAAIVRQASSFVDSVAELEVTAHSPIDLGIEVDRYQISNGRVLSLRDETRTAQRSRRGA